MKYQTNIQDGSYGHTNRIVMRMRCANEVRLYKSVVGQDFLLDFLL